MEHIKYGILPKVFKTLDAKFGLIIDEFFKNNIY